MNIWYYDSNRYNSTPPCVPCPKSLVSKSSGNAPTGPECSDGWDLYCGGSGPQKNPRWDTSKDPGGEALKKLGGIWPAKKWGYPKWMVFVGDFVLFYPNLTWMINKGVPKNDERKPPNGEFPAPKKWRFMGLTWTYMDLLRFDGGIV